MTDTGYFSMDGSGSGALRTATGLTSGLAAATPASDSRDDGVAPGNVFSVYRIMYPSVPTARNVVGEATVVSVRERTATAKITYSRKEIMLGDQVQLR